MDKDYQTVLLEQIRDQNKAILEGQKDQATRADIARIEHRLDALEGDMQVVNAAVKDVTRELDAHESDKRIHLSPGSAFGRHVA